MNPNAREPALDYIIHDPYSNEHFLVDKKSGILIHDYREEERRRALTVKLKNAVMIHWLDVKQTRTKPQIQDLIKNYMDKKKAQTENPQAYKDEKKKQRAEKKERLRKEALERQREADAHLTSYINAEQFESLFDSIETINKQIS